MDWNQRLIEAKQKLAQKRSAMGIGVGTAQKSGRLPPGQHLVDSKTDFPVL